MAAISGCLRQGGRRLERIERLREGLGSLRRVRILERRLTLGINPDFLTTFGLVVDEDWCFLGRKCQYLLLCGALWYRSVVVAGQIELFDLV